MATIDASTQRLGWAYYAETEDRQAAWLYGKELDLTSDGLYTAGNQPYVIGTDWNVVIVFLYTDADTGYEEGINLTGATVTAVIANRFGSTIKTLTNGSGITLASQTTARSAGGTRGEFTLTLADTDLDDAGDAFEAGIYAIELTITDSGSKIIRGGKGLFEMQE